MVKIRFIGPGRLKLPGSKYDPIESGETKTVTEDVAVSIQERDDVQRVGESDE